MLKWAYFTMGPNGQNQHFAELRHNVCLYIHAVVLLRGLQSLEGKNKRFVGIKRKKLLAKSSQTDYNIHETDRPCMCRKILAFS